MPLKEVENLRQIADQKNACSSVVQKRERQYERLGTRLSTGSINSIEKAVKFGELRQRVFESWHIASERVDALDETLSQESVKVEGQLRRLSELGNKDASVKSAYEVFKEEFDSWKSTQPFTKVAFVQPILPTQERPTEPEPEAYVEASEAVIREDRKQHEIELSDGKIFVTKSEKVRDLTLKLQDGQFTLRELAIALYNTNTPETRSCSG